MSSRRSESEQRLLEHFKVIEDIKAGRQTFRTTAAEQRVAQQQAAAAAAAAAKAANTPAAPVSVSGQKLPSKIRLKQSKAQPADTSSTPTGSPTHGLSSDRPTSTGAQTTWPQSASASASEDQAAAAVGEPEAPKATISRDKLAALLKKQLAQQQHKQPTQAAAAPDQPLGGSAVTAAAGVSAAAAPPIAAAPTSLSAGRSIAPAARGVNRTAAPATPTGSAAAGPVFQQHQQQQAPVQAQARQQQQQPARTSNVMDVDYDAVSSPEYEVDYDAVSSPEYEVGGDEEQPHEAGRAHTTLSMPAKGQQLKQPLSTSIPGNSPPPPPPPAPAAASGAAAQNAPSTPEKQPALQGVSNTPACDAVQQRHHATAPHPDTTSHQPPLRPAACRPEGDIGAAAGNSRSRRSNSPPAAPRPALRNTGSSMRDRSRSSSRERRRKVGSKGRSSSRGRSSSPGSPAARARRTGSPSSPVSPRKAWGTLGRGGGGSSRSWQERDCGRSCSPSPSPTAAGRRREPDAHTSYRRRSRSHSRSRRRSRSRSRGRYGSRHAHSHSCSRSRHRTGSAYHRQCSRSRSRSRSRDMVRYRRHSPDYRLGAAAGASPAGKGRSPSQHAGDVGDSYPASMQDEDGGEGPGGADTSAAAAGGGSNGGSHRRGRQQQQQQQQQQQRRATLFVGDLPPLGFTSSDLLGLFAAYGWDVLNARVMGSQCYGFVEFVSEAEAEQALNLVQDREPGFSINGAPIRASWARGSMPAWKQGRAVLSKRDQSQGLEGLEAYEHPTLRLMKLQTTAAFAGDLPAAAAAVVAPAALASAWQHVLPAPAARRPSRQVIDYGDL